MATWANEWRSHATVLLLILTLGGCRSAGSYRGEADRVAQDIIQQKQIQGLGHSEPFDIEPPAQTLRRRLLLEQNLPHADPASLGTGDMEPIRRWPDPGYLQARRFDEDEPALPDPLVLTMEEALMVAAANNREYQSAKEQVYRAALALDLERHAFRLTFRGLVDGALPVNRRGEETVAGVEGGASLRATQRLQSGATLSGLIALDLVRLLTQDRTSSRGIFADATITIPLLRGAGRHIVAEPLTQAERDALYAIWNFETFKRSFAVRVAADYLSVLRQLDQVQNAEENYRRLIVAARRARRYADEDRLPEMQVDQAVQDQLRARSRWISTQQSFTRQLDGFKITLGLPTDARVQLDREEMARLPEILADVMAQIESAEPVFREGQELGADAPIVLDPPRQEGGGPLELDVHEATALALEHRLDLWIARKSVEDAQRQVMVSANLFLPELTFLGRAQMGEGRSLGSAGQDNARLRPHRGNYEALLTLDLPLDRVAERNIYRNRLIDLERSVRNLQAVEDSVKLDIRNNLRTLLESREELQIQTQAVALAQRRVQGTDLLLELGRADIRDVLEAQEALLSAQNALTAAMVGYRVAELNMQRDLGLLQVNNTGLWREFAPGRDERDGQ